jgi:hypothetical protein
VFIQLLERRAPDPAQLDRMVEAERQRLTEQARQRVEGAWIEARRAQLAEQERIRVDASLLQ